MINDESIDRKKDKDFIEVMTKESSEWRRGTIKRTIKRLLIVETVQQ